MLIRVRLDLEVYNLCSIKRRGVEQFIAEGVDSKRRYYERNHGGWQWTTIACRGNGASAHDRAVIPIVGLSQKYRELPGEAGLMHGQIYRGTKIQVRCSLPECFGGVS